MNSNSTFFYIKAIVIIAIITAIFYYFFSSELSKKLTSNRESIIESQSVEDNKEIKTKITLEKEINHSDNKNSKHQKSEEMPPFLSPDSNNYPDEMQMLSMPASGEAPEAGDTGEYGPPPESGDTDDYGEAPEAGDTGEYGPPPESMNPDFIGIAPEDGQP